MGHVAHQLHIVQRGVGARSGCLGNGLDDRVRRSLGSGGANNSIGLGCSKGGESG